jgi:beta-lactamase regulating signal transducer with metallopeptidase domain
MVEVESSRTAIVHRIFGWDHRALADEIGPAVLGHFRPQIIVPRWVLTAPPAVRSIILMHEQEHIAAGDPLLLLSAFMLVVVMPWKVPLWWQLQRLRFAMEVDCWQQ